jgi:Fe-S-cluster-containing dehydrogenase component
MDRRDFLKKSLQGLVIMGIGSSLGTSIVKAFAWDEHPKQITGLRWGFGVDIEKCIGCGNCVRACKTENNVLLEPFYFRTWVERYYISETEKVTVDSPNGGFNGFPEKYRVEPGSKTFFVPKLCNHCEKSACIQVCPVGATFLSPDGVVLVDKKYCLGCRYCVQACPYGCRYIDPRTKTVDKCTLCYHRINRGLKPACVEICPTNARIYGNMNDKTDPIYAFLRNHKIQVLKPHMGTKPRVYYNGLEIEVR